MYVNDLPNSLGMFKGLLFTDDLTVYASSSSLPDLVRFINHELSILQIGLKQINCQ